MNINVLKYKILLDDNLKTAANKINHYQDYGFEESDLIEILFALTDEIIKNNYMYFCDNCDLIIIEKIQNQLKNYLNMSNINITDKQLCLMWLNIFNTYNNIMCKIWEQTSKITDLETKISDILKKLEEYQSAADDTMLKNSNFYYSSNSINNNISNRL